MFAKYRPSLVFALSLLCAITACKARQGSNLNEISSGTYGAGDSLKNCEELLYEIERYQPKFNEAFEDYLQTQCDVQALSDQARAQGKTMSTVATPTEQKATSDGQDIVLMHLADADGNGGGDSGSASTGKVSLESLGMKPDPKYVQLADPANPEKTAKCQGLKKYLEERTVQLAGLRSEVGGKCSPQRIRAYEQGQREYIIVDHPTCGYFSRCDDAFSETNNLRCQRCWLDTYQQRFLGQSGGEASERADAAKYKNFSSLTCSSEDAARDAVELFCNNIKPGSCDGPRDPKIKCEPAPARDYKYDKQTLSGGLYQDWSGTEQSYSFTTKFDTNFDNAVTGGVTADGKVVEVNIRGKTGLQVTAGSSWNMALKVKSEVGLFTLAPPAMISRGGIEEGALNTKFACGIQVTESSIDSVRDGAAAYVDVSIDTKAKLSDPTGITGSEVSVGTSNGVNVSSGFDNVSSSGLNQYKAFQSLYLSGAGMTKEGMQAACDRYNQQNMHLILGQFLSSAYAKFKVWRPKDNYCRSDKDCNSGNGWIGRCGVTKGQTVGQCYLTAGHGMQCPTQTFSSRACDRTLGCKLKSWTSFLGYKFNQRFECWPCMDGKKADGYCADNDKY